METGRLDPGIVLLTFLLAIVKIEKHIFLHRRISIRNKCAGALQPSGEAAVIGRFGQLGP